MRAAFLIAGKDLRLRFRDRSALVLGFVAPLLIATVMSLAFQGAEEFHATVGFVDDDGGPVASALADVLHDPALADVFTVRAFEDAGAADRAVDHGDVDAAVVVPRGFSEAATRGGAARLDVLTNVDSRLAGQVVEAVADSFVGQVNAVRLSVAAAVAAGAPAASVDELADRAGDQEPVAQLVDDTVGGHELKLISYYAPGMGIFFVLFAISFMARSFNGERTEGTLDRMAAAPVRPSMILVGKSLSAFVFGLASLTTMAVVTSALFGADWGPAPATAAVLVATMLAVVALGAVVTVASRTDRQADQLSSIVVFGLALVGGNFVVISQMPAAVRAVSLVTPTGWAMRAFTDLGTGAGGSSAVQPVVVILAITAAMAAVASVLARRVLVR